MLPDRERKVRFLVYGVAMCLSLGCDASAASDLSAERQNDNTGTTAIAATERGNGTSAYDRWQSLRGSECSLSLGARIRARFGMDISDARDAQKDCQHEFDREFRESLSDDEQLALLSSMPAEASALSGEGVLATVEGVSRLVVGSGYFAIDENLQVAAYPLAAGLPQILGDRSGLRASWQYYLSHNRNVLFVTPDQIITGPREYEIEAWDPLNGKLLHERLRPEGGGPVTTSFDGRYWLYSQGTRIYVYDPQAGQELGEPLKVVGSVMRILPVAADRVVVESYRGDLWFLEMDPSQTQVLRVLKEIQIGRQDSRFSSELRFLETRGDGTQLIGASQKGGIAKWSLPQWERAESWAESPFRNLKSFSVSDDGETVVAIGGIANDSSRMSRIAVWTAASRQWLVSDTKKGRKYAHLEFMPGSQLLLYHDPYDSIGLISFEAVSEGLRPLSEVLPDTFPDNG